MARRGRLAAPALKVQPGQRERRVQWVAWAKKDPLAKKGSPVKKGPSEKTGRTAKKGPLGLLAALFRRKSQSMDSGGSVAQPKVALKSVE
jgi:hypothetical protein